MEEFGTQPPTFETIKTTFLICSLRGGQFAADFGGQFAANLGGQHTRIIHIGEDYVISHRYLNSPHNDISEYNSLASPEIYLESNWSGTNTHSDGGVARKWFYLLANGGTFNNVTVQSLGLETADDIAYITFNWWLWPSIGYTDAAHQAAAAAEFTYGQCSQEHKQTRNAWRAVGITFPFLACPRILVQGYNVINTQNSPVQFNLTTVFTDTIQTGGTYS